MHNLVAFCETWCFQKVFYVVLEYGFIKRKQQNQKLMTCEIYSPGGQKERSEE